MAKTKFSALEVAMSWFAKRELRDEDWKTQLARGHENIPKGAEVQYEGMIGNFYGNFAKVRYNGVLYYVRQSDLEYRE